MKKLKVAIQMDPLEKLDLTGDSTFVIGLEAQKRKHILYHFTPDNLFYKDKKVFANMKELMLSVNNGKEKYTYGKNKTQELAKFDIILMRQDPPFDLAYITATHLLEKISKKTLIINNPYEVRNSPEKIFVTQFDQIMPKTMITRDIESIKLFRHKYKDIVIKPLYGNGGEGVFRVKSGDENFNSIVEIFLKQYKEQFVVQEYLPDVRKGDKRIILIDGETVGAVNRVPAAGDSRSNMHAGGTPKKTTLTKNDHLICKIISPFLREKGLFFVGIDIIGKFITEINVTSPTGIREINKFNKIKIEQIFWDKLEKKLFNH
tara:strand:- start:432 stop:1385 length:954 start_codon:yes stop_codon:yes gene_type:complete